jgi:FlaA1/EpsC-like NDP-sugar epimerase
VLASGAGLYDRDELLLRKTTLEETPRFFAIAGLLTLVAALAADRCFADPPGSAALLALWMGLTVALLGARTAARFLVQTRVPVERCVLIGTPADAERLRRALGGTGSPSQLTAQVPVERILVGTNSGECEINVRALDAVVRWSNAQRIIISAEHATSGVTLDLLRASKAVGVRLSFLSVVLGAIGHGLVVDDVYGIPLVGVRRFDCAGVSASSSARSTRSSGRCSSLRSRR